jgi:hypothetical protein
MIQSLSWLIKSIGLVNFIRLMLLHHLKYRRHGWWTFDSQTIGSPEMLEDAIASFFISRKKCDYPRWLRHFVRTMAERMFARKHLNCGDRYLQALSDYHLL